MTDRVEQAMEEVWAWKRQAEEATRGMDSSQLIEFYRREAKSAERRLGLRLRSRNASDLHSTTRPDRD